MARGQERFNVFCSPCHGRTGSGNGMVVQRGFRAPPSYHEDRLRNAPVGYFFDVMTNGFGAMQDYASQVPVADRWAIAAYIRALQLSQRATVADVPADRRAELDRPAAGAGRGRARRTLNVDTSLNPPVADLEALRKRALMAGGAGLVALRDRLRRRPRPLLPLVADRLHAVPRHRARVDGADDDSAPDRRHVGRVPARLRGVEPHAAADGAAVPADRRSA